jgi:halimadienyl-diphosphate synthase
MTGNLSPSVSYTSKQNLQDIERLIEDLLPRLGNGEALSVPYDTAWVARLSKKYPGYGFERSMDWLRYHQHADGTWGGELYYYHDRILCTLMAIIALKSAGGDNPLDEERIRRGENALWRLNGRLHLDAVETTGFPVLVVSLIQEALTLGLDVPTNLYRDVMVVEKKLNMLGQNPNFWKFTTMSFSLEAARAYFPNPAQFNGAEALEGNYSVGTSPAATSALLLHTHNPVPQALDFVRNVVTRQGDGGAPFALIDTFEIAWALHHLQLTNAITPDHPQVRRALDYLWDIWQPGAGMPFSEYFSVPDLDCTSVAFSVLKWAGYPIDPGVFTRYEEEDHFFCYPGEIGLSLSVHVRMMHALQFVESHEYLERWENKIAKVLRQHDVNGYFWFDKWHISPYYLTCEAIYSLQKNYRDLAEPRIKWILKTQQQDGGWGYYGKSTPEETAYCLQSLTHWDTHVERMPEESMDAAARYLWDHLQDKRYVPLWIAKCLYTPTNVVRTAILTALYGYLTTRG